ncbi:MAG: glycosyltransferase [Candidatus Methanofastidiosa archaeon]|nr:glycosyltransferase [Candidatus Methanofastidiosa archaeon]
MKIGFFIQSYLADYNFGSAHFLRGLIRELSNLGHSIKIFCPENSWVERKTIELKGNSILSETQVRYPIFSIEKYSPDFLNLGKFLSKLDVVIVNEWTDDKIAKRIGLFGIENNKLVTIYYDTHHRILTATEELQAAGVCFYKKILVLGESVKLSYQRRLNIKNAIVFPEAVDEIMFNKNKKQRHDGSAVWIGNYGYDERGKNLITSLIGLKRFGIPVKCYGAGFPKGEIKKLGSASINVHGWIPNIQVPMILSRALISLHIPREPYTAELGGVSTIRPYEASGLAVPLVVISKSPLGYPFVPNLHYKLYSNSEDFLNALPKLMSNYGCLSSMALRANELVVSNHTCRDRALMLLRLINNY